MPYICNAALSLGGFDVADLEISLQGPISRGYVTSKHKSYLQRISACMACQHSLVLSGFFITAVRSDTSISKLLNRGTLHKDRPCSPPAGVVEPNCMRGIGVDGCNVAMTSIHRNESHLLQGFGIFRKRAGFMPPLGKLLSKELLK